MISRSVWDYTRKLVSSVHMLQEMVGGEGGGGGGGRGPAREGADKKETIY